MGSVSENLHQDKRNDEEGAPKTTATTPTSGCADTCQDETGEPEQRFQDVQDHVGFRAVESRTFGTVFRCDLVCHDNHRFYALLFVSQ